MKTIKEMAEESYPEYDDKWTHDSYIDGANDVLKEVFMFLKDCQKFIVETPRYPYFDYKRAIEALEHQLKGE